MTAAPTRNVSRYLMAGTQVAIRKVGTTGSKPYTLKRAVDVPADAPPAGAGLVCFAVDGWEIVAPVAVMAVSRKLKALGVCPKCAGRGHIPAFSHVQGGVCFKCGGHGFPGVRPVS